MGGRFLSLFVSKLLTRIVPSTFAGVIVQNIETMKKKILLFALALPALSCDPSALPFEGGVQGSENVTNVSHEMIVLGDKLEDPYSIGNIEAAVKSLYPQKAGRSELKPTDMYVRFLPVNEKQYDLLLETGVHLTDHPLDYAIVKDGDYYHDPSLPEGEITWQYAVVPPDYGYPSGIRYEILDRCYIADNDVATRADDIDWAAVEREAFRLTGNENLLLPVTKAQGASPKGRITIVDEGYNGGEPTGLAGVKVSCNTFVKFSHAYTDEDGYYEIPKTFTSNIRYRLVFQNRLGFAIGFNLLLCPASTSAMGTNSPEGVDLLIDSSSEHKLWSRSVVNNAAYDYITKCFSSEMPIVAPPTTTRFWIFQKLSRSSTPMLQQGAAVDGTIVGRYLGEYADLLKTFLPDITLGIKEIDDYASIYDLTCHELSHASHFSQVGKTYWNKYITYVLKSFVSSLGRIYGTGAEENAGYCEIGEMWAYYMDYVLSRDRYGDAATLRGTSYWFSPQIFLYMDERGLDRSKIFKALTSTVTSRDELQTQLETMYPEFDSIIEQAFDRYGRY